MCCYRSLQSCKIFSRSATRALWAPTLILGYRVWFTFGVPSQRCFSGVEFRAPCRPVKFFDTTLGNSFLYGASFVYRGIDLALHPLIVVMRQHLLALLQHVTRVFSIRKWLTWNGLLNFRWNRRSSCRKSITMLRVLCSQCSRKLREFDKLHLKWYLH